MLKGNMDSVEGLKERVAGSEEELWVCSTCFSDVGTDVAAFLSP